MKTNLAHPVYYYLSEVLGIEQYLRPDEVEGDANSPRVSVLLEEDLVEAIEAGEDLGSGDAGPSVNEVAEGLPALGFVVVLDEPGNAMLCNWLNRIAQGLKWPEFQVKSVSEMRQWKQAGVWPQKLVVFSEDETSQEFFELGRLRDTGVGSQALRTHSLKRLLQQNQNGVNQWKRKIWNHLKALS